MGLCKYLTHLYKSAKPEFDYIRDNFGHKKGAVQYTGFARYDSLCDFTTKNKYKTHLLFCRIVLYIQIFLDHQKI